MKTIVRLMVLKARLLIRFPWNALALPLVLFYLASPGMLVMPTLTIFTVGMMAWAWDGEGVMPRGAGAFRALPATWRQLAVASVVFWALATGGACGLLVATTPFLFATSPFLLGDVPFVSLQRLVSVDALGLWTLTLPVVAVGARATRLDGPSAARGSPVPARRVLGPIIAAIMAALAYPIGAHGTGQLVLGVVVTALVFMIPDAWLSAVGRRLGSGSRVAPVRGRLDPPVPTETPVLRLWWMGTRREFVIMSLIILFSALMTTLLGRAITGRVEVNVAVVVPHFPLLALLLNVAAEHSAPKQALRTVLARLPASPAEIGESGLRAGALVGAVLGSVTLIALMLRTWINPKLEPLGGADAGLYAVLGAAVVFVVAMVSQLARVAPVGSCPHYTKLALASVLPLMGYGIDPSWCPAALLLAVTSLHLAMEPVILVRIGRVRPVSPR